MTVVNLLRGKNFHFGSPVDQCWTKMQAGLLHPKVGGRAAAAGFTTWRQVQQYRTKAEQLARVEAMQAWHSAAGGGRD